MKQTKLFGSCEEEPAVLTSLEYAKAEAVALQIKETVMPLCDRIEIVGSLRRKRQQIGDCDFIATATDAQLGKDNSNT